HLRLHLAEDRLRLLLADGADLARDLDPHLGPVPCFDDDPAVCAANGNDAAIREWERPFRRRAKVCGFDLCGGRRDGHAAEQARAPSRTLDHGCPPGTVRCWNLMFPLRIGYLGGSASNAEADVHHVAVPDSIVSTFGPQEPQFPGFGHPARLREVVV